MSNRCRFLFPIVLVLFGKIAFSQEQTPATPPYSLFALCMDTADEKKRTIPEQAEMLSELGFDGLGHLWLDRLEERIASCKEKKLVLQQVYLNVDLGATPTFDPRLGEKLPLLKGMGTQLALLIGGGAPSDAAFDEKAVAVLGEILTLCEPNDVQVVLYPHRGSWLEKTSDALRIARRFPRGRVGVMFNLCHFLAVDDEKNIPAILKEAYPDLKAITINGSDTHQRIAAKTGNWLQPLDSGDCDLAPLFATLVELDYRGPIGLQCYGIPGDTREHLRRSVGKWKEYVGQKVR